MPGALNVPSTQLAEGGRLVAPERIRQIFAAGGVDLTKPIITSCGSGVGQTAHTFFLIRRGRIAAWVRVPDGASPPPPQTATSSGPSVAI